MTAPIVTLILRAAVVAAIGATASFAYNLYQQRMRFRSIHSKYGLPILPHSFLLGHLIIAAKVAMKYPNDIAESLVPYLISQEYPEIAKPGYFYLDLWPVAYQMIVVSDPDMMAQFCQDPSFPKHRQMIFEFGDFTHGVDLVTSNGQLWKTWRTIFSPGFSSKNIQSYIPAMLKEYNVFRLKMASFAATGETVSMDKHTMALTVDIIGHAVLGAELHAQTTGCEIFDALKRQIALALIDYSPRGIAKALNPFRPFQIWYNNRVMRNGVLPYILDGIRDYDLKGGRKTMHQVSKPPHPASRTWAVGLNAMEECHGALAVKSYLNEHSAEEGEIDAQWINIAVDQFKMLLFAGHDTVSSTFCFVTALLHNHPDKLAKCREELDTILGPIPAASAASSSPDPAQTLLIETPELLNRLVYLTACIKETLRLFGPVSGSVRQAPTPNQHLHHPSHPSTLLPLWDMMVYSHQAQLHRNPTYWPGGDNNNNNPHSFIPERFLAKEGDELYPRHKHAFRPFEMGSRNCIGQEFAMTELRLVLALALREWDLKPVFRDKNNKKGKTYFGMDLWQTTPGTEITMHPREGMPMRVVRRRRRGLD